MPFSISDTDPFNFSSAPSIQSAAWTEVIGVSLSTHSSYPSEVQNAHSLGGHSLWDTFEQQANNNVSHNGLHTMELPPKEIVDWSLTFMLDSPDGNSSPMTPSDVATPVPLISPYDSPTNTTMHLPQPEVFTDAMSPYDMTFLNQDSSNGCGVLESPTPFSLLGVSFPPGITPPPPSNSIQQFNINMLYDSPVNGFPYEVDSHLLSQYQPPDTPTTGSTWNPVQPPSPSTHGLSPGPLEAFVSRPAVPETHSSTQSAPPRLLPLPSLEAIRLSRRDSKCRAVSACSAFPVVASDNVFNFPTTSSTKLDFQLHMHSNTVLEPSTPSHFQNVLYPSEGSLFPIPVPTENFTSVGPRQLSSAFSWYMASGSFQDGISSKIFGPKRTIKQKVRACTYCRRRKIACGGAAREADPSRACKQCEDRGHQCETPEDDCRSRKPKTSARKSVRSEKV